MTQDAESAWHRRYREGELPGTSAVSEAFEVMLGHRSIRAYADHPLPEHLVQTLVAAAQSAPTSSNKQFWSVLVVRDAARKARLATLCRGQQMVANAPLLLVWLADLSRLADIGARHGRVLEGLDHLESFLVAALDTAFAAQNALVAAESIGLGTVYVGAMRDQPEAVAAELALPPRCVALFGMCIGYPGERSTAAVKPRLPQEVVLHEEVYRPDNWPAIARHDQHHQAFRREQALSPVTWSEHIMARVADARALEGREHLRSALRKLGFLLR